MVTKPKSNSVVTHDVGAMDEYVTFTVLGAGKMTLEFAKMSDENQKRAMVHGMIQRISDAAAISRNPDTGKPATAQEKYDRMAQLVAHYESGTSEWSRVGQGGGNKGGYLFRALQILYPNRPIDELKSWMDKKSKSEQAALRASPKVRAIIDTFVEDSDIDTDAMLDELDS